MDEYVVKQKQSKQLTMVILAIVMVLASGYCFLLGQQWDFFLIEVVGIVGMLFFGLCLLFIFYRFVRPQVLLVVKRDGIVDNSSTMSTGFLSWHEISGFGVIDVMGQSFISIDVKDVDAYLAGLSMVKSKLIRANMALGYPPISITLQTADRSLEEVLQAMTLFQQVFLKSK